MHIIGATKRRTLYDEYRSGAKTKHPARLEVFSLGHRIFKSVTYWYGSWKFKKALAA